MSLCFSDTKLLQSIFNFYLTITIPNLSNYRDFYKPRYGAIHKRWDLFREGATDPYFISDSVKRYKIP